MCLLILLLLNSIFFFLIGMKRARQEEQRATAHTPRVPAWRVLGIPLQCHPTSEKNEPGIPWSDC